MLDFLATDLIDHGWKLKRLHRMMVLSATYRQASVPDQNRVTEVALRRDPSNNLLWHARVRRRDAESIRDGMLQASGRLDLRMFGPAPCQSFPKSCKRLDTAGILMRNPRTATGVLSTSMPRANLQIPLFREFDAPDRIAGCPTRVVTTTAPQAR